MLDKLLVVYNYVVFHMTTFVTLFLQHPVLRLYLILKLLFLLMEEDPFNVIVTLKKN